MGENMKGKKKCNKKIQNRRLISRTMGETTTKGKNIEVPLTGGKKSFSEEEGEIKIIFTKTQISALMQRKKS
jgi:hypothetical protein